MNATQEYEVRFFDGECVAQDRRGRRSDLPINKTASRWIAAIVAGLLIGFAGAATAINRYPAPTQQQASKGFHFVYSAASVDDVLW